VNPEVKEVALALINQTPAILTAGAVVVTALISLKSLKQSKVVAAKVEEVKHTAAEVAGQVAVVSAEARQQVATTLASISAVQDRAVVVLDKTHTLVNNAMGLQKESKAKLARRIATMTKDAADIAAAIEAENDYADHMAKQAKVDVKAEQTTEGA
jgi:hypothetical protein